MKAVNAKVLGRRVKAEHNGHEWEVDIMLFVDETAFIADSPERLQILNKLMWF